MPTDIYFDAESLRVKVEEDPGEVAEAFAAAGGLPFRLTGRDDLREIYINPAMVAFWSDSEASPRSEPQESPRPAAKREVVDLWGNPLGKKKRRR